MGVPATSNNEEKELDEMATMATVLDLWQRPLPKPLTVQDVLKVEETLKGENEEKSEAVTDNVQQTNGEQSEQQQPKPLSWDDTPVLQIQSAHTFGSEKKSEKKKPKPAAIGKKKDDDKPGKKEPAKKTESDT